MSIQWFPGHMHKARREMHEIMGQTHSQTNFGAKCLAPDAPDVLREIRPYKWFTKM